MMRRELAACAAAVSMAVAAACEGTGGLSGGPHDAGSDASGADAAGTDASATDASATDAPTGVDANGADASDAGPGDGGTDGCPGTAGPAMVALDAAYCIDSTEVTNGQYGDFLAATSGDAGGQPAFCSWNSTLAPTCTTLNPAADAPVACVDWCDAYAYCAWAGKRLCGKIGGGASSQAFLAVESIDQWYAACFAGSRTYCYGGAFDPGACNVDKDAGPEPVALFPFCVGGYPGIFNMNGNVAEWEDACGQTSGATDSCLLRGGSYADDGGSATCPQGASAARNSVSPTIGFRCCSP